MAVGGHTGHSKIFHKIYRHSKIFHKIYCSKYGVRLRRQPLTYSRALGLVRDTFRKFGLNPNDYGLHSLLSGGASAAAATEVPECLIARQARWKSLFTVRRYIQEPLENALKTSKACSL